MKDLFSNIGVAPALAPAVHTAAATTPALDLRNFGSVVYAVSTGAIVGDGDFGVVLQHSDTATAGDFVDVPSALTDSNAPETLEAASGYKLGYKGGKRFVRLSLTKEGGTSIAASATAILGHPAVAPVA